MSYNQYANQQNFGRTQGSAFGMRNTQSSQFGQQSFNQPRISVNDQFLNSQNGGLQPQRSQQEFNPGRSNAFRQNQRAFTPDNMQFNQFGNSSAQSGKQFQQPGFQTGYTQPFAVDGGRQQSTPSQMMDYTSPDRSGQFQFGRTNNILQSNGFDPRATNMNRTNQNMMGSTQFAQQEFLNQAGFFGPQMSREINVETVRSNMAQLIKDQGHRTANSFLREFDAYDGRVFETWELMTMFKLSSQQVRALLKQIDPEFHQKCTLKALCQELRAAQVQVDVNGFTGSQSEYGERFNRSALQSEFRAVARYFLSSEFTPNGSNSYQEVYVQIKKFGKQGSHDLEVSALKDFLDKKCGKFLNPVQQSRFIEFVQYQRNSPAIKDVQFVHAMRQILPDQKRWDLGELLQYIKQVEPAHEKDKIIGDHQDPINPLLEKIRQHLYNKALYNEIDSRFKSQLRLKLKLNPKETDHGDHTVAPMTELSSFLESLQHELKFTQKEKEALIARYFVIPQNLPQAEKAPTPPPSNADASKTAQNISQPSETLPKTASQQLIPPVATNSKELSHAPSSESLARESPADSRLNLPAFNNAKVPDKNQENNEDMEEEIYEDDGDFDSSRALGDEKVAEAADKFEGGSKEAIQKWFSLQKFKADMQPTKEMMDKTLTLSRPFKFEILQAMKGWVTLTGGSISEQFKLQDKKGTLLASQRQLKQVLTKIMAPKAVSELHLQAVLEFFGRVNDQGHICIEYMQFYQFFYKYANLNIIEENDPRFLFLREIHDLNYQNEQFNQTQKVDKKDTKSLGRLMGLAEFQKRPKDQPIEVEAGVLFQVYQKLKLRVGTTMRRGLEMQRFEHEKEIKDLLKVQDGKFNLVFFQELLGIRKEEEPQFSATNAMRQLCSSLQLAGISIEMMRHNLGKQNQIQRFMNDLYIMLQSHGVFDGSIEQNQLLSDTIENLAMSMSLGSQINAARFVGKIEFEMHKLVTLQHFYIKLKSEMRANSIDLGEVLVRYGADRQQREISRENLLQMLKLLNMIGEEDNGEFQYFIDEYDSDDNKLISFKSFEDDYEEFVGSPESYLELLSQKVLGMIMMVSSQYHQSDLVATINTAFESQPSNQIRNTWMQNYDFSRWFQVAIIESQYQSFDLDLIELFLQYTNACDNSKTKKVNIPNLLKKIAETHLEARTENLKRQLAILSVKTLHNRIVQELQKRNQKPDQYFQGRYVNNFQFERMLTSGPFNLQTLELNSSIQEIGDLYRRSGNEILLDDFVADLNQVYELVVQKANLFKQIQHALEEKGQDIHIALKMIKGQLNSSTHMSINEFFALVALAGVQDIDQRNVLQPIFEKFDVDSHGEVSTDSFLLDFESATVTKQKKQVSFQIGGKSLLSSAGGRTLEPSGKPITARRNHKTLDQCIQAIAKDIEDRQLNDFGSFLKGYDFTHSNKIDCNDFFKVLTELFKDQVIGKGDILDFIQYLDPNQLGKIDIQFVADEMNRVITNPNLRVVLISKVDEAIEDKIFDPIDETSRMKTLEQPNFVNNLVLDLYCGLIVRKQQSLSDWLAMFSRQEDGFTSLVEFNASLEKLDSNATKGQKKAWFDYLMTVEKTIERDEEQKKIGLIPTQLIIDTINNILPQSDIHSLVQEIVSKICLHLHNSKTPLEESSEKYELAPGSGQISYVDFTHGLLQQELKLEKHLSRNMIEVLQIFFNPDRAQVFSLEPFLNLVKQIAFDEGLKIFMTSEEVEFYEQENFNQTETMPNQTRKVAPKAEPSFEVRSQKNTFFNGEKFTIMLSDPQSNKLNDDIIIGTRQKGVSVEKHFQSYGRFSSADGLRKLDLKDFREALSDLKLEWASKTEITASLYRQIEDAFQQQTLSLDMIGQIVYFNSNVNIQQEEAKVLESIHQALYSSNLLGNIEEIFNFHNFKKDGCLNSDDFQKVLLNQLGLIDKVSAGSVGLLTQRYRVNLKDTRQQVFSFRFVEDLAYQHLNIGLLDQWASKIIEQILKQLQVKLIIEARRQPLQDSDAFEELKSFFSRNCQQSRDEIFYEDIYRTFSYLRIIDETDDRSKLKVDNFFKFCSLPSLGDLRTFKFNSFNAPDVQLPISIKLNHFFNALQVLGRKPLTCIYQDIFLKVYFSSKKRGVSIYGPDLTNLFIHDDISQSGQVPLAIFIDRLKEKIIEKHEGLQEQDLIFLATKYIAPSRTSDHMINYTGFLEDYNEADTHQVTGKLSIIFSPEDRARHRELQVRFKSDQQTDTFTFKTIDSLTDEQKPFFVKMSKYLVSKDLDEILCIELVNSDQPREGFLPANNIKNALKKIGIPISQSQLQQLLAVLSADKLGSYSYLELISILFGLRYMQRVQSENGLWSAQERAKHEPKFDISKLKISQRLIDQLELRLIRINHIASELSKSQNFIRDQEVFTVLKKAEIELDSVDLESIQIYIRERRDSKTNLINLTVLLKHFKVGEETSALLYQIQQQLASKDLNGLTSQPQLTFIDFKAILQRAGVTLPKQGDTLERLFRQISQQKKEVSRATLLRNLQFQPKPSESLQLPPAPPQVVDLLQSLSDKKIDLKQEFIAYTSTKRVPVQKFEQILAKHGLKANSAVLNFFKGTHGDLNLPQILAYLEQVQNTKKLKPVEMTEEEVNSKFKAQAGQLPEDIRVIFERISLQLQKQRIDTGKLFQVLDQNGNGLVELTEFDAYCCKENLIQGLPKVSIERLFKYLDSTGDGSVSINELCLLIKSCKLNMEERMAQAFTKEFEQELIQEIILLFDRLDTDKNRWLTAQELVIIFKNDGPNNSLSLEQAKQVIDEIDKDSNGRISRDEFVQYILGRQKQSLLDMDDKLQDLRDIFSTLVNVKSGFGIEQHLTPSTFKQFLQKAGLEQVNDKEAEDLFAQIDTNLSGTIDIDELIKFVTSNENIVGTTGTTLLQLRKKRAKLNQIDMFDFLCLLPPYLQTSFTQQHIENQKEGRISTSLMPNFDFTQFKFGDLQKVKERAQLGNREFIAQHKPNFGMEFTVTEIKGVPNLAKQLVLDESQTHIEVRYFLFDAIRQVYSSSVLISHAQIAPQKQQMKGFVPSQQWCIPEYLKTVCLRGSENWHLVIELVQFDQRDKSKQVAAGWTSCPLTTKAGKTKLPLRGGSPFNSSPPEIVTQENQAKPKSGIAKLFGSSKPPVVERHIVIEIQQFFKLDERLQSDISLMPENTIFFKNLTGFVTSFRTYCHQKLVKCELLMQKPKGDLVLSQFSKIYDSPDLSAAIAEHWTKLSQSDQEKVATMKKIVEKLYTLINDPEFGFDHVYPTRSTTAEKLKIRMLKLKECLLSEKSASPPQPQKTIEAITFTEDYQPFTMNELSLSLV